MRKLARVIVAFAALAFVLTCAVMWYTSREPFPPEIRIATGKKGGLYDKLAIDFAERLQKRTGRPVRVIETTGTEANVGRLRDGAAELALIQTISSMPEGVTGITPLYSEPLHFIARKGTGIKSPNDLAGKRVALGLEGSGMRQVSKTFLTHYEIKNVRDNSEYFGVLDTDPELDAALVTTGWMNPTLEQILRRPDMELISIDDPEGLAMRNPWLTATTIPRGLFPGKSPIPRESVRTVAVTALLVSRSDASNRLVREALAAIYETDLRSKFPAILSAKAAKDFDSAVMHPSAASYHNPEAEFKRMSQALELISKSKEAMFGVIAVALLIWGWIRRRREQKTEAAEKVQRQKLDDFIARTLTVELEQMEVTDPEQLRPFLRRVTQIKHEALRELTSEKIRGDQLFAIFLSQCAALSEKIQMRMMYGRMSEDSFRV